MRNLVFTVILVQFLVMNVSFCQTNLTDSIVHQTYHRKFMVHLPPDFNTSTQRALVINLHGGSGNMINAQGFSRLNTVSDQNDFVVAWPQGYGIAPPGFSWADGRNTSADQAGIDDIGFIDKLLDSLISRFSIDTNRIYICGFSNGGFMVQRIACKLNDRFAAMASLGSSMDIVLYNNCNPSKPIPMAFFNGTADPAMPFGGGTMQNPEVLPVVPVETAVQFWVSYNNCQTIKPVFIYPDTFQTDNSTAELYSFTDCDCNSEVKFYKLINGGHTWPGVYVASQESILGNTNRDINASIELWNFFNSHSLCKPTSVTDEHFIPKLVFISSNPASEYIEISAFINPRVNPWVDNSIGSDIKIYNTYCECVMTVETKNFSSLQRIDISHLPVGLYFIQIGNNTEKFVVVR